MCGRFTITVSKDELRKYLKEYYEIDELKDEIEVPRYNVAPGQKIISIINDGKKNRVGLLQWGFVPPFAKDEQIGNGMINARSETLHEKSVYKASFEHKRCVILADGFYEWKKEKNNKIPMRVLMKDKTIFPMAGLWSTHEKADGSKLHTCTIVTTQANELVSSIHERMPVILTEDHRKTWLNPRISDYKLLWTLLKPYEPNQMFAYPVSSVVNRASHDEPECIEQIA
ncbi:MAG: SOS response-associated peptidase [Bacillota bacterium]